MDKNRKRFKDRCTALLFLALAIIFCTVNAGAEINGVDNLLDNPDFESAIDEAPEGWQIASGSILVIAPDELPSFTGEAYAGNIGGIATATEESANEVQHGTMVQLVDLSSLSGYANADALTVNFSGNFISRGITGYMDVTLQYLPEGYNDAEIIRDDAAWNGNDVENVMYRKLYSTNGLWNSFSVKDVYLPAVRWMRVILNIKDTSVAFAFDQGLYLGGFDNLCLQAEYTGFNSLIANGSFEEELEGWHQKPGSSSFSVMQPGYESDNFIAREADGGDTTACIYQVVDLKDNIIGWLDAGSSLPFIRYQLNALVKNPGGAGVRIGLEYLPSSYTAVDGILWDDAAWEERAWVSDGTEFTNQGGDAIDSGYIIEDTAMDPEWHETACEGWLPRVRWLRIRIEMDAPAVGALNTAGLDKLFFDAECYRWGPYSGFGNLPEATFYESPNAPDKGIPAWVGPEGDGISGGYTGQTKRNYVNPAFAGFADDYTNYSNSGQWIYNDFDKYPEAITGIPWNDAGWNGVIITLGDMDEAMMADYFGPAPSGNFHPGEITAVFNESPITNGPGHDFATFENGFSSGWTSPNIFAELAYVEVSSNGTDFVRFPTHSLTPEWPGAYGTILATGVFGMTGKHVNAYGDAWGTPFDLDWIADHPLVLDGTVDLNDIRYVKQVDIPGAGFYDAQESYTSLFHDSYGNPIFDAWLTWGSGGVDLDAVAAINSSAADSDGDHITDYWDNCSQSSNDNQYDTDQDGYGNMCDCDIDGEEGGDGVVNYIDYQVFRAAYGGHGPERIAGAPGEDDTYTDPSDNWNAAADFNGDNVVNYLDYQIFRARYGSSAPFE